MLLLAACSPATDWYDEAPGGCGGKCDSLPTALFYPIKYALKSATTVAGKNKALSYVAHGNYANQQAVVAANLLAANNWNAEVVWVESVEAMIKDLSQRAQAGEKARFIATVSHAGRAGPYFDNPAVKVLDHNRRWVVPGWDWHGPGKILDTASGDGVESTAGLRAFTDPIGDVLTPDGYVMVIGCNTGREGPLPRDQAVTDDKQGTPFWIRRPKPQVRDNGGSGFNKGGTWHASTSQRGFLGSDYLYAAPNSGWAVWSSGVTATGSYGPGRYEVQVRYTTHANRTSKAVYRVYPDGKTADPPVIVDQRQLPAGGWRSLGIFTLGPWAYVSLDSSGSDGYVVADAARFLPLHGTRAPGVKVKRYKTYAHSIADMTKRRTLGTVNRTDLGFTKQFVQELLLDGKVPWYTIMVKPDDAKLDRVDDPQGVDSSQDPAAGQTTISGPGCDGDTTGGPAPSSDVSCESD
jgi:hypothetical protein